MARLYDSNGLLLGGLQTAGAAYLAATPEAAAAQSTSPTPPWPSPGRTHDQDETVAGLECSYGTFTYDYADRAADASRPSRLHGCHNPVETPDERHHCAGCGGDYCTVHAEPAAHDCRHIARRH